MNTLANTYYLKALDNYPFDLTEFLEAINYALSYDENSADANYLMGRFCMEQLYKYDEAKHHFEIALSNDINHLQTYYYFIRWSIDTGNLKRAKNLITYASTIEGASQANLLHRLATVFEKGGKYKKAKKLIKKAIKTSFKTYCWNRRIPYIQLGKIR